MKPRIYRSYFWAVLAQMLALYWGLTLLRRVYFLLVEDNWIAIDNASIVTGSVFILALAVAVVWWCRIELTDDSVKGLNAWCRPVTFDFSAGVHYRVIGIPGFRYLNVRDQDKQTIWLTLPARHQSELFAALDRHVDEKAT